MYCTAITHALQVWLEHFGVLLENIFLKTHSSGTLRWQPKGSKGRHPGCVYVRYFCLGWTNPLMPMHSFCLREQDNTIVNNWIVAQVWWGYCSNGNKTRSAEQFFTFKWNRFYLLYNLKITETCTENFSLALQGPLMRLMENQLPLHVTGLKQVAQAADPQQELGVEVTPPQPASAFNWHPQRGVRDPQPVVVFQHLQHAPAQPCSYVRLWKRKRSKLFELLQQSTLKETNDS